MEQSEIEKRNAAFAAASPEEKRVMVADEIDRLLNEKIIKPRRGYGYLQIGSRQSFDYNPGEVREKVKSGCRCTVCAIGACFVAMSLLGSNTKGLEVSMNELLGREARWLVEEEFERNKCDKSYYDEKSQKAIEYGASFGRSAESRLRGLTKAIRDSGGKEVIPGLPIE